MGELDVLQPLVFSVREVAAAQSVQPGLLAIAPNTIEGELRLNASFDGHVIQESHQIRIVAPADYPSSIPTLEEIGGRTASIAQKYGLTDLRALHRNHGGTACVCVKQMQRRKFPPGSDLTVFIQELVVPYLYGLSFYDSKGVWPWGEYSHGALGLIEFYADDNMSVFPDELAKVAQEIRSEGLLTDYDSQIRQPAGDRSCLCGSDKPLQHCHPTVWRGIVKLNGELHRLGLDRLPV